MEQCGAVWCGVRSETGEAERERGVFMGWSGSGRAGRGRKREQRRGEQWDGWGVRSGLDWVVSDGIRFVVLGVLDVFGLAGLGFDSGLGEGR